MSRTTSAANPMRGIAKASNLPTGYTERPQADTQQQLRQEAIAEFYRLILARAAGSRIPNEDYDLMRQYARNLVQGRDIQPDGLSRSLTEVVRQLFVNVCINLTLPSNLFDVQNTIWYKELMAQRLKSRHSF